MENKKSYTIGGAEYYVPDEISAEQYQYITALLDEAKIKPSEVVKIGDTERTISVSAGEVLFTLSSGGKIPKFFAILLVPKGDVYWDEKLIGDDNLKNMKRIGDKTAIEVLNDFLSGRADLIP